MGSGVYLKTKFHKLTSLVVRCPTSARAKLTFPRQSNFSTTKLSFARQKSLSSAAVSAILLFVTDAEISFLFASFVHCQNAYRVTTIFALLFKLIFLFYFCKELRLVANLYENKTEISA